MMAILEVKVGADPEVFLFEGGNPVSAYGVIPGSKEDPYPVANGAVQVDGMALEFNIDPANNAKEFLHNINSVMETLDNMVKADIMVVPVAEFGKEYISKQPNEAVELGCDPDYNAWLNGRVNPKPDGDEGFRTAAGHVHIGWTEGMDVEDPTHLEACIMLTKQLDVFLGLPSLIFDGDTKRREMYGAPGAFRPKPYGVEYRVLSNQWLESEELINFVYKQVIKAVDALVNGKRMYEVFPHGYIRNKFNAAGKNNLDILNHQNILTNADVRMLRRKM